MTLDDLKTMESDARMLENEANVLKQVEKGLADLRRSGNQTLLSVVAADITRYARFAAHTKPQAKAEEELKKLLFDMLPTILRTAELEIYAQIKTNELKAKAKRTQLARLMSVLEEAQDEFNV